MYTCVHVDVPLIRACVACVRCKVAAVAAMWDATASTAASALPQECGAVSRSCPCEGGHKASSSLRFGVDVPARRPGKKDSRMTSETQFVAATVKGRPSGGVRPPWSGGTEHSEMVTGRPSGGGAPLEQRCVRWMRSGAAAAACLAARARDVRGEY